MDIQPNGYMLNFKSNDGKTKSPFVGSVAGYEPCDANILLI